MLRILKNPQRLRDYAASDIGFITALQSPVFVDVKRYKDLVEVAEAIFTGDIEYLSSTMVPAKLHEQLLLYSPAYPMVFPGYGMQHGGIRMWYCLLVHEAQNWRSKNERSNPPQRHG